MKQKIKSLISLKATNVMFGLLFFVALVGGVVIDAPNVSAAVPTFTAERTGLNAITLTFSENVDTTTTLGEGYTLSAGSVTANTDPGGTGVTMVLTTSGITGTSATPTVTYGTAAGTTVDTSGTPIEVVDGTNAVASDGVAPTMDSAETKNTMTIDVTFSEDLDMTTIIIADFDVAGSFISGINESAGIVILTLSVAIATDATPVVTLVSGEAVSDTSGNAVTGDGSATYDKTPTDGIAPTVALTYSADPAKAGAMTVTATYSEAIVGTPNISINQQGTTDITTQAMSGGATVWTYAYTVVADNGGTYVDGVATVSLSTVADSASNNAAVPTNTTFTIDTTAPTVAITSGEANPTSTSPFSVTITFNEAVTTFVVGDIIVGNGTAGNFVATSALIYTADITSTASGTVTVDVAGSVAIDAAGNNNTAATQFSIVYDGAAPTATFSPTSGATGVAVDTTITLTFSEAMRLVAGNVAITNSNVASLITLKKTNSSGANVSFTATVNTGKTVITITPSANLSNGQLYYVAIGATVEDTADNALVATTATFTTVNVGSSGTVSPIPTSTTGQAAATPENGGNISKTNSDGTSAKIVLPADALIANAVITINPIVKAEVVASMPLPNEKNIIGDYAYNFTAINALNNAVNNFEKALALTFTYTDEQAEGMNEGALKVYYWDDVSSKWVILVDSEVDTANNVVTATTTHFTYFAVFEGEGGIVSPSEIIDGDIIQCQSSDNPFAVYIVKIVGDTKYIRHIVSLEIFDHYTHLKWENLKQVDSLDVYSLSGWARVNTGENGTAGPNDKVYEINGDQSKHWINMTAEDFLSHGGSEPAIYSINQGELDLYTTGVDVMSL